MKETEERLTKERNLKRLKNRRLEVSNEAFYICVWTLA
jgi:hypothetical protein